MEIPCSMEWETHVEPPRIPSIRSDHLHDHPANGIGVIHLGIHRQFQRTWMDAQGIKGVPINNIVFFKRSVTLFSDACEYGIGGYNENGITWQWIIPAAYHGKLTLNLLELLSSAVTINITILKIGQGSHILAFTDISSALGLDAQIIL